MSQKGHKTAPRAAFEELLTPKLGPGKACLVMIRGRSVGQVLELSRLPAVVGRAPEAELPLDDVAVSRTHARIGAGPDGFAIEDLDSTNGVFVNGVRVARHVLLDGDRIQVGSTTVLKFCLQDELEASFQKKLYDSATRDSLTGLYNRRFFVDTLDVDFSYAYRNHTPLSLLLLDLDHFKSINDSHGHMAGDAVLKETAEVIQRGLRTEDVGARHGGEEFAVMLRYTDAPVAYAIAERIRRGIEERHVEYEGHAIRVTTSIGLATLRDRCYPAWQKMIEAADGHLYKAKQQGRNRTHYAGIADVARSARNTISLTREEFLAAQEALAQPRTRPPAASDRLEPSARPASKRPPDQD
jgi:two-component system, cell cycle response regulator